MTWHCQACGIPNSQKKSECNACGRHWQEVWAPPKRKSRSRPRKKSQLPQASATEKAKMTPDEEIDDAKDWTMHPHKAPWIMSTPQARLRGVSMPSGSASVLPIPPPPDLPRPPAKQEKPEEPSLTAEETKIMASIKELKSLGLEISPEMEEKLNSLEAKAKEISVQKSLSHAHLNKLDRAESKVGAAAQKLRHLDQEWKSFMQRMSDKITYHAQMYELSRGELMETYNTRLQELRQLKAEMNEASKQRLGTDEPSLASTDMQDIQGSFQALTHMIQDKLDKTVLISDDEMEPELIEAKDEESESKTTPSTKARQVSFRQSTSGSPKVAVGHLKKDKSQREPKE